MSHTKLYSDLPDRCKDPKKRKRTGRGQYFRGGSKKSRAQVIAESSSASESPMKSVTFDLTTFSDNEEEELRYRTSDEEDKVDGEDEFVDENEEGSTYW